VGNSFRATVVVSCLSLSYISMRGSVVPVTLNIERRMVDESPTPLTVFSRRGKTLAIAKIIMVFADGTREQWDFPEGADPALYRQGGNRQTRPAGAWTTHTLWWTSDKKVEL
jgi:hypothetical protein